MPAGLTHFLRAVVLVLGAIAFPFIASADVRFDERDHRGAVIVEFSPATIVVNTNHGPAAAHIWFSPLSRQGATAGDWLNGHTSLSLASKDGEQGLSYDVQTVIPGTYVSQYVGVSVWGVCYSGRYTFDLKAGEAVFIGRVDRDSVIQRVSSAIRSHVLPDRLTFAAILRTTERTPLTPPSDLPGWETRVTEQLHARFPHVNAALHAANLEVTEVPCPDSWRWFPSAHMFDEPAPATGTAAPNPPTP